MTTILSTIGLIFGIFAIIKFLRTKKHHAAAMNIIFAKYTYDKLSQDKKKLVREVAKDLVLSSPTKLEGYKNEVERYSWYALAMNELGIQSKVPENPVWNKVKNPYTAIKPGNRMFDAICGVLKTEYGIDIKISKDKSSPNQQPKQK